MGRYTEDKRMKDTIPKLWIVLVLLITGTWLVDYNAGIMTVIAYSLYCMGRRG